MTPQQRLLLKVQIARQKGYSDADISRVYGNQMGTGGQQTQPTVNTGFRPTPSQDGGLLSNIFRELIEPAEKVGRRTLEGGRQLTNLLLNPAYRKSVTGPGTNLTPEEAKEVERLATPKYISESDLERVVYKPFETAARQTAGMASYGIPAGKTLPAALGLGSIAGGLRAGSEEEADFYDIGGGALGGAIGGGAGFAMGKLLEKIGSAKPGKVKVTGKNLKSDPFFTKNRAALQEMADEIGLDKTMLPTQRVTATLDEVGAAQSQIDDILSKASNVSDDKLLDYLIKNINETDLDIYTSASQSRYLNSLLSRLDETSMDPVALNSLKSKLRGELGTAFRAINRGSVPSVKDQAKMALYKTIKESLDDVSPQVRTLNNRQKLLYDLAEEFADVAKSEKPLRVGLPFMQPGGFRSGIGANLPATQSQLNTVLPRARQTLGKITPSAPQATQYGLQTMGRLSPQYLGAGSGGGGGAQPAGATSTIDQFLQQSQGLATTQPQAGGLSDILTPEILTMGLLGGDISSADITALQNLGIIEKQPSVSEKRDTQRFDNAINGLNTLKEAIGNLGSAQNLGLYQTQHAIVSQQVARLFESGRLSDADRDFYRKRVPNPMVARMFPGYAKSQIDAVISLLKNRSSSELNNESKI